MYKCTMEKTIVVQQENSVRMIKKSVDQTRCVGKMCDVSAFFGVFSLVTS